MDINREPTIVIVNLLEPLKQFLSIEQIYIIYQYFPLKEIIAHILQINPHNYRNEIIWTEIGDRITNEKVLNRLDLESVDLFLDCLCNAIDEHIRRQFPIDVDSNYYIFDKWVDGTSLALRKDYVPYLNIEKPL